MAPDDLGCTVLHVDMDAFYAQVATRDRPDLDGLPVVVGGGGRGVVLSASYPARAYGVRSAMPMTRARRLCPQLVVVPPDFGLFEAVSDAVMETFRTVTPVVEPLSMDEAFLDVSGTSRRFSSPAAVGEALRSRIADEQRITCSVGIATTATIAKLASRRAKPDGQVVVPAAEVTAFLHPLAVEELWGVGEATAARLHQLGLHTVGDLAYLPVATMQRALGPALGAHLHALAWGVDARPVVPPPPAERSMGSDETFARDTDDPETVRRELLRLSRRVTARMRAVGVVGRTVTLKVRFADFTTITRARTLRDPTCLGSEVYACAVALLTALGLQRARIRLVGVRVEGLRSAANTPRQLVLGERECGWEALEAAVDRAIYRFGRTAVQPATLLPAAGQRRSA